MFNFVVRNALISFLFVTCTLSNENSTCSLEMFDSDFNAYMACVTQFAHQSNWFPSPIAGLFSYEIWNGYDGFWQNGAVLEPMVNFMVYAHHTRYLKVVKNSVRDLYELQEAYGPYPSFDDMVWYGISYVRIYEVLGASEFLQPAIDIFKWCWKTGWDHSEKCHGGMFFDNLFDAKQTITNVEMYQLAAKLYRFTNDSSILHNLRQIENFLFVNKLLNSSSYLLSDGLNIDNCSLADVHGYTYEAGNLIGAFSEIYKFSGNETYLVLGDKVATATIEYNTNSTGIFTERNCDPNCDEDAMMFKGIFVRNLRYFMDAYNNTQIRQKYQKWMDFQVQANVKYNMCNKIPISKCNITFQDGPPYYNISGPVFSPNWNGPFTYGAPMQQTSVMDLFVSSIKADTKCSGKHCDFDPYYPPPQALTCGSHPCPPDEECCEYSPYSSYTCCAKGQKCNKQGICL